MRNLLYITILLLGACGGSSPPSTPNIGLDILDSHTECWATLSWRAPTERVDNTPLSINELDFYIIWIYDVPLQDAINDSITPVLLIELDAMLVSYEIRTLSEGPHYFVLTVTDLNGLRSDYSNEARKICM